MAQHFLRSKKYRALSLKTVLGMKPDKAYKWFCRARWPDTDGKAWCPYCGTVDAWETRRRRFKCREKTCRREFSVTSGTIFANHKLTFNQLLALTLISANSVKGKAALVVTRELGVEYKTAWTNLMKLREAIAAERSILALDETIKIDGMYIGGSQKPANRAEDRIDRRLRENQTGKRRCVIAIRQEHGRTVTAVTKTEDAETIMPLLMRYAERARRIVADEHAAYNQMVAFFPEVRRVNHQLAYRSEAGDTTNEVESFFSRFRRGEWGIHHRMVGTYLDWYAAELAFREDFRRRSNRELVQLMLLRAMAHPVSRWLKGYWQGNHPPPDAFLFQPRLAA